MNAVTNSLRLLSVLAVLLAASIAAADPCGMVPPIYIQDQTPIARIGLQKTYVFFREGVETFVIRPGFSGNVEDFGMLIPFPEPPAIRKVPDDVFPHVEKAIDPPEVVVDVRPRPTPQAFSSRTKTASAPRKEPPLKVDAVRVVRQEAVGMYEVAVLEAGSAAALKRWMDDHKYKFPDGMEGVCNDYIELKWCFVAVKTRVGMKKGVDPRPGQRRVNGRLPSGASFDGHVQAMGFRFHSKQLIVPMRLSAYNEGELRNVVYLMAEGPRRIRSIPEEYVVRQISGEELYRNVTGPLPLRIIGGTAADIPDWRRKSLPRERDPRRRNGHAKELFATDLLAVQRSELSLPHEESEKMLLRIGERLGLRGGQIDTLHAAALKADREKAVASAVEELKKMSLTVIDGDFPREVLGEQNLQFAQFKMPARRNSPRVYHATRHGPTRRATGTRHAGELSFNGKRPSSRAFKVSSWLQQRPWSLALAAAALAILGLVTRRTHR